MKAYFTIIIAIILSSSIESQTVWSPDKKLNVSVLIDNGKPYYTVKYENIIMLENSPLGLKTSIGDFTKGLKITGYEYETIKNNYTLDRIKRSNVEYIANALKLALVNNENITFEIEFRVSNNNIGFRYNLLEDKNHLNCRVLSEVTGFNFPSNTTTFLSPQASPGLGWKGTKPSYEEEYVADELLATPSKYGEGYTFPSLFHVGENGWILISETGVDGTYCGAHLGEGTKEGIYSIAYPNPKENNGIGSVFPGIALPKSTPWRTITVSNNLKPIVETTIPFDLVEPLYEASQDYKYGRSTWSWIMWQDDSMNYDDQLAYINLASTLGYEYILMDAFWDVNIGYDRMKELIQYAQSKGVDVFLWYNSNGFWNDAFQSPKNIMNHQITRRHEMKWLQEVGVKGLKVDFFGGDKQETLRLYEEILSDANDYGLMIIFHGCTLPRGWEKMYPNYIGSEAVLASENLIFTQHANDMEAFNASLHPFIRNTVGSMEFGPVLLNKRHNRTNDGGTIRKTTDAFQLATAILFQNSVQMFALAPNNLKDVSQFEIDFMKEVPTTWDDIKFIDGYPGTYCLIARRKEDKWYIAGVNASDKELNLNVELPMLSGKVVNCIGDDKKQQPEKKELKIKKSGKVKITMQPNGGIILFNN
ncbi:glycoside hydrolase family 97 catalytic domain-containing protein [Thalassobellus suaedae]|uniref:Glycoside hydrolase family 97 catalytic domain-containing protein n=1 Tax=Thalassobellus suaedae TaxID=3074124 RepID=A0ABY9XXB3_9FLAO|nr:glycoside hydrolase family 97 catalytic domain-containing protein [Flavobacteriaceae bacterium HL-DH14]